MILLFLFSHRGLNAGLPGFFFFFFFQESPCAVAKSQETPPPLQGHTCAGGQPCVTGPLPVGVRGCGAWEGGSGVWTRPAVGGGQPDHLAHAARCWFSVPRPARPSPPGGWLAREVISLVLCRVAVSPIPTPSTCPRQAKAGGPVGGHGWHDLGVGVGDGEGRALLVAPGVFPWRGWVGCGFNANLT